MPPKSSKTGGLAWQRRIGHELVAALCRTIDSHDDNHDDSHDNDDTNIIIPQSRHKFAVAGQGQKVALTYRPPVTRLARHQRFSLHLASC
jgi:hypothetical protein